jgi:glycosyltransferase involved in cell wall biosynthesis
MELIDPIRNNVEYVNEVPYSNIPEYYDRMDISMVLYNMKGIASYISPTKLYDSMAMGVPVIASDVGETRDFVEKYECGLVIESNERELIINAMETMIFNPDLRMAFGQNGLRAARTTTNWEREKKKFVEVFEDCIRAR